MSEDGMLKSAIELAVKCLGLSFIIVVLVVTLALLELVQLMKRKT
jgi:hypothetical protein